MTRKVDDLRTRSAREHENQNAQRVDLLLWHHFPRMPGTVLRVQRGDLWDERGRRGPAGGGRRQADHRHGEAAGGGRRHRPSRPHPEIDVVAGGPITEELAGVQ